MQLNQFRFLIAVDKYGSISRAAQALYISQSTISISLIRLEEELGVVLLNRGKRGVSLTEEGKKVLACAVSIQEALEKLEKADLHSETVSTDRWFVALRHEHHHRHDSCAAAAAWRHSGVCISRLCQRRAHQGGAA